jgi:hypothetical protein
MIASRQNCDAGRVSVFLAIAFFGVLAVIGVAADVPGLWAAMLHTSNVATEAARAAGQAIDVEHTATTGQHQVDPAAAVAAAHDYLHAAGVDGTVTLSEDLTEITVSVTYQYEPQVLGLFGMPPREVSATHTATLLTG